MVIFITKLLNINRNTANQIFNLHRDKIFQSLHQNPHIFSGEVELDESYYPASEVSWNESNLQLGLWTNQS